MINKDIIYFWSPSMDWEWISVDKLRIGKLIFTGNIIQSFPELYYMALKGVSLDELFECFKTYSQVTLEKFIQHLIEYKILINNVQSIDELLEPQMKIFNGNNQYNEDIRIDDVALKAFMERADTRAPDSYEISKEIKLTRDLSEINQCLYNRCSIREFDKNTKISFSKFSSLLSVLSIESKGEIAKRCYPSAGALYPIDCYFHIKKDRIEGIDSGLYYYQPYSHKLLYINSDEGFSKNMHYNTNQDIYESSAFSMYLVYDVAISMPKYRARAYCYGIFDAGLLMQTVTLHGESQGFGNCIIGIMQFDEVSKYFKLTGNQKYILSAEFGLKVNNKYKGE